MKAAAALAWLLLACGGGAPAKPACLVPDGGASAPLELDVLFMIDDSGGELPPTALLTAGFPRFLEQLAALPGGLPSLHIGVISSDLGAGGFTVRSCERAGGDQGALQASPRVPGCQPPHDAYIADLASPTGRGKNYLGSLPDELACVAELGAQGCGFEQQLESIKRALDGSVPGNAGFLRPDAWLAIVIFSDEDDCSAKPPYTLYDPAASATLGPLSSYRCTAFGLRCDPNPPWTMPGARQGCQSNEDSPYLQPVQRYIDFLTQLKGDRRKVFVTAILGDPGPVVVGLNQADPILEPSCQNLNGGAEPGVRLAQLARAFDGSVFSICADDYRDALSPLAQALNRAVSCQ